MLCLKMKDREIYDEVNNQFLYMNKDVYLEHSLLSLSKWEAEHEKAFLGNEDLTQEETRDYIEKMVIDEDIDPNFIYFLNSDDVKAVQEYMNKRHTATVVKPTGGSTSYQYITSELIYSWMAALQIPFTCETWNLNRLLTLIQVTNENNQPKKKMSHDEAMARQRAANAARRAKYHSKG